MSQTGPIDRPIEPPAYPGPVGSQETPDSSATDVAKDQASEVKDTTKQAGQQVVQETKQQVGQVAAEAKNQTGNLLRQGVAEINSQAGQQQQRLAQSVHSIAKELGSMASSSDQSGPMTGLAQDASRRAGEAAHWLENHEPSDILDGLRSFARRRPGTFLLGAAAAGVLVGRLTRGIAAEAKSDDDSSAGGQSTPGRALPSGQATVTEPIPAGDQPIGGTAPTGPDYSPAPSTPGPWSPGPSTPAVETGFDDTLPRGLGEAGPR